MERTHTLTDAEVRELAGMVSANGALAGASAESLIAALPSRQPKDPDAGLGAQPWILARNEDWPRTVYTGDSKWAICNVAHKGFAPHDPEAVSRAILAAPKAIKLARRIVRQYSGFPGVLSAAEAAHLADAKEVLSVVDGESGR